MTALIFRSRSFSSVVLALASGAVMSTAGYAWRTNGWLIASLVMIPGGLLISLALALLPRSTPRQVTPQPPPSAKARRLAVSLLVLVSGGVMVGAGYEAAGSAWLLAAALVLLGGIIITAALVVAIVGHRIPVSSADHGSSE